MPQNFFDPGSSMNALANGMKIGGAIRDKQTMNALSPMVAKGDYKGAMEYAGSRGDLGMVNDMRTQYQGQLDAEQKARQTGILRLGMSLLQTPQQQRDPMRVAQDLAQFGVEVDPSQLGDLSDASIQSVMASVQDEESLMKQYAEYQKQQNPEGKVVNDRLVNPYSGAEIGDYSDPAKRETQADALGRLRYIDTGEIVPGYEDAKPNKPLVTVNTGDMGAGGRPIVDKPPKGYQRIYDEEAGTYRDMPIPGSQDERDAAGLNLKATQRLAAEGEQFGTMIGNIDSAIEMVDGTSAGFGAMTSGIPTSPARNLRAKLETVQALIGFDKLNEMRQTSPTGGALGNVTERELQFLQSVRGSLDTGQSPEQLKQTLSEIKDSLSRLQEVREIAFRMENGMLEPGQAKPRAVTAPPDPAEVDALVNKYLGGAQ
jgi:hypothetical protein